MERMLAEPLAGGASARRRDVGVGGHVATAVDLHHRLEGHDLRGERLQDARLRSLSQ